MEDSDRILIQRLVATGDADAFSALVSQYADMVYSASRRIVGNDAQAADVVQETFFQFLKNADRVTGSVAGWLHRVATWRAVDLVRQDASRRRREEDYARGLLVDAREWGEIEPLVDEALEDLPEEWREVLVLHYLKGKSLTDIAEAEGVSQPTISRRSAAALEQLRRNLRARDVIVGLAVLGTMLAKSTQAAPAGVLDGLGRISLALAASSSSAGAVVSAGTISAGLKIALAAAGAAVVAAGASWFALRGSVSAHGNPPESSAPVASNPARTAEDSSKEEAIVADTVNLGFPVDQSSSLGLNAPSSTKTSSTLSVAGGGGGNPAGSFAGIGHRFSLPNQGAGAGAFTGGRSGGGGGVIQSSNRGLPPGVASGSMGILALPPATGNTRVSAGTSAGGGRFGGTFGGTSAGVASFNPRTGSKGFYTNFGFSQSWAMTNGSSSFTQSSYSFGTPGGSSKGR